ncbi:hypothetical protein [Brachybacterium vulturis]|nr:hypothetical protein [Brachybacterium vulturis]
MRYRLGFWIGPAPADAEAACAELYTRVRLAEEIWREFDRPPPPVPRIRGFVDAVLGVLPADPAESSPWKHSDVADDAMADTFTPTIRGPHRGAIAILTRLAHDHGLQAFDLAAHRLLDAAEVIEVDGGLWTDAHLGGGADQPEFFDCRGPEIARERLGLPAQDPETAEEGTDAR